MLAMRVAVIDKRKDKARLCRADCIKYKYLSQLTSPSQPHRASYLHHHFLYARVVTSLRSCLNIPNITVAGG